MEEEYLTAQDVGDVDYRAHNSGHGFKFLICYLGLTKAKKVKIDSLTAIAAEGRPLTSSLCLESSASQTNKTILTTSRQAFSTEPVQLTCPI